LANHPGKGHNEMMDEVGGIDGAAEGEHTETNK
jgi:hypothetical protein